MKRISGQTLLISPHLVLFPGFVLLIISPYLLCPTIQGWFKIYGIVIRLVGSVIRSFDIRSLNSVVALACTYLG